jgi:adenylate cyclase
MTATGPVLQDPADLEVARTVRLRVLRNERVIGATVAIFFALLALVLLAEAAAGVRDLRESLPMLLMAVCAAVSGALLRVSSGRALGRDGDLPMALRVGFVVLEPLLLFGLLVSEGQHFDSEVYSLYGPMPTILMAVVVMSGLRMSRLLSLVSGLTASFGWAVTALVLLERNPDAGLPAPFMAMDPHIGHAVMLLLVGIFAGHIGTNLRRDMEAALRATHEQHRVRMTFGRHVSPKVAEALLNAPDAGTTQTRFVTVMFLDVRGFTAFSERRGPEEVVAALEGILAICVSTIEEHGGVVNKFLGDGLLAVFGAPLPSENPAEDTRSAVEAAARIVERLDVARQARTVPDLDVGIGVHCGEAVVGTVGPRDRREYTLVGDTVNLASRIEGLTRDLGSRVLVSQSVWDLLRRGPPPEVLSLPVKNRAAPVAVVRVA